MKYSAAFGSTFAAAATAFAVTCEAEARPDSRRATARTPHDNGDWTGVAGSVPSNDVSADPTTPATGAAAAAVLNVCDAVVVTV